MKRISRELHVSRNTLRKILRSGETDFTYEREHQPLPKIGPWVEHVDRFLFANEGKAARERLMLVRIYEAVRALGYDGSYDAVRRYAKTWLVNRHPILTPYRHANLPPVAHSDSGPEPTELIT